MRIIISKKEIVNSIKETLESSSIHALPNIIRNRYFTIKFVWVACFLASAAVCGFFIFQSISDYFNYEVVTQIEVKKLNSIGKYFFKKIINQNKILFLIISLID
jgi:hypothetical protein